jgi:O-antigen ligase
MRFVPARQAGAPMRFWPLFMFLLMAISSFVQQEPAPYDLLLILAMPLLVISGAPLPSKLVWPAIATLFLLIGYGIGTLFAEYQQDALNYLRTSSFLTISLLFFAAIVWRAPERILPPLLAGLVFASFCAACIGIAAYFGAIPNAEAYALYGRASGPFKDPNVFGPSLILPMLYLVYRLATRRLSDALWTIPVLLVLLLALFLSFSRGAWANFAICAFAFVIMTYLTSANRVKLRLVGFVVLVTAISAIALSYALSLDAVRSLFAERVTLAQEYDLTEGGRFDSMRAAFQMALEHPLGIGPLQWPIIWGLMPHNIYVNVFVSGGLLSLVGFVALTLMTLWLGFRALAWETPFRGILIVALAVFVGHALQGFIIDSNHWRHLYIVMGIIWGLSLAAERDGDAHAA